MTNQEALEALDELAYFQLDWDSYGAEPPNDWAIDEAIGMVTLFVNRMPDRIKPSVIGGVGITFYNDDKKVYVEIYNDEKVYALFSDGVTDPEVLEVTDYNELMKQIDVYFGVTCGT